jgi:hypothetical protein
MKILLGDFNAKVGRENIFKPTIGKESLHQDSNDKGVRVVNFATAKNLVVKSTMFPHRNNRRRQSSVLDVRSFRGADCDTDHCLVVAKVRERLAVSKQAAQKFDGERFKFRKLNELEVKKSITWRLPTGLQLWRT